MQRRQVIDGIPFERVRRLGMGAPKLLSRDGVECGDGGGGGSSSGGSGGSCGPRGEVR
jgi:hypothetical protein